ncbi:GNAT family protein [Endozoicomonas sp. 8E]|uniref:GNAT family N-acetyltransferase n=1 Tax=Endozoicomonas sp. 8E TaxID=3035692 RepID=UPI002938D226|nr:GNAT family protein [Endozoicomonas sp. 8E]WOG30130.1 GNAT family protein [Endozoicomonas sp. 8E]
METERIKLSPPSMELVSKVHDAIKESENNFSVYLPWVPSALSHPEENMKEAIKNYESFNGELRFFIIEKSTDDLLGAIGLIIRDKTVPFFEIGYWLRDSKAGKGFVSEALKVLEHYAFQELGAKRVEIRAAECNKKSRAVAGRNGYQLEAIFINERRLPSGELSNTVVYGKTGL